MSSIPLNSSLIGVSNISLSEESNKDVSSVATPKNRSRKECLLYIREHRIQAVDFNKYIKQFANDYIKNLEMKKSFGDVELFSSMFKSISKSLPQQQQTKIHELISNILTPELKSISNDVMDKHYIPKFKVMKDEELLGVVNQLEIQNPSRTQNLEANKVLLEKFNELSNAMDKTISKKLDEKFNSAIKKYHENSELEKKIEFIIDEKEKS